MKKKLTLGPKLLVSGVWELIERTDCIYHFPQFLKFAEQGTFTSYGNDPELPQPIWDVGEYKIKSKTLLTMSLINDAYVDYTYRLLSKDTLVITTPEGCVITYRKQ